MLFRSGYRVLLFPLALAWRLLGRQALRCVAGEINEQGRTGSASARFHLFLKQLGDGNLQDLRDAEEHIQGWGVDAGVIVGLQLTDKAGVAPHSVCQLLLSPLFLPAIECNPQAQNPVLLPIPLFVLLPHAITPSDSKDNMSDRQNLLLIRLDLYDNRLYNFTRKRKGGDCDKVREG